jgi:3-hydroxy acid dehydrogenase/malonic semialdehyde reductase
MSLEGQNVLITGASSGIGEAIAKALAQEDCNLILLARSENKLKTLIKSLPESSSRKCLPCVCDVTSASAVSATITDFVSKLGPVNVLINNAGLALGAPKPFHELSLEQIDTMTSTNLSGYLYTTHAVLNAGKMLTLPTATILNVTSVTGLELPPFSGESIYHTTKAAQEAFTNALRNELTGTNVKVLALRPGVVATHFHKQRVGYDDGMYEEFMDGYEPLQAEQIAKAAVWMLKQEDGVSVKALDVVPTAQRSLQVFDREWNARHHASGKE